MMECIGALGKLDSKGPDGKYSRLCGPPCLCQPGVEIVLHNPLETAKLLLTASLACQPDLVK